MEKYCKIKVDIEGIFLFFLNSKKNTHLKHPQSIISFAKSTISDLNIKIVIAIVTQYKMQASSLVVANSYGLGLDKTQC